MLEQPPILIQKLVNSHFIITLDGKLSIHISYWTNQLHCTYRSCKAGRLSKDPITICDISLLDKYLLKNQQIAEVYTSLNIWLSLLSKTIYICIYISIDELLYQCITFIQEALRKLVSCSSLSNKNWSSRWIQVA